MPERPQPKLHVRSSVGAAPVRRSRSSGSVRYAELRCVSNFSFLRGASHPEELIERAALLDRHAIAITDENSLAGAVRMHAAAKQQGVKLLVGSLITPIDGLPACLYATDRAAYGRLARLITRGRLRMPKGRCHITFDDIAELHDGLLCAVVPPTSRTAWKNGTITDAILKYQNVFGECIYLAAELHRGPDDESRLDALQELSRRRHIPLVAANDVHYHTPERRYLQDVLTCIRERCSIAGAGTRLFANAERHMKSPDEMGALFRVCPDAVTRTAELADRCRFSLDELRYEYPEELCPPGATPFDYLTQLVWEGAGKRYLDGIPGKSRQLLDRELRFIEELRYEAYFLTVWDLVRFARSKGILCQGRGSAANSAVCYCLGVTALDPDRFDLLFERFVSKERNEPPDIDIDFEHERREEVFQYIYKKYGRERAGITAEVITYRPRSAIRDVGKALGFSLDCVDRLAKTLGWWDAGPVPEDRIREAGLDPNDRTIRRLGWFVQQILGFPRHLSQHVGGFVITQSPLCEMVPLETGGMPGRTFIQWDKDDIDALGMMKVDCLALGMLTALGKCFDLVNHTANDCGAARAAPDFVRPTELTLTTIPPEDPAVYDMLCQADSVGVFQVESRAQMSMLPRLQPREFYDLVIEVAIVRPGPIQGGMVHPYLRRRAGEEREEYPSQAVREVLHKTKGVPIFQEQAMRLAVVAAGFTPGEADRLRRAMGAWRKRGVIEAFRQKLIEGMLANGYAHDFAERIFQQLRGFGEYGFPESHSASFALLVYTSAWLKRYHPAAFAAALINSQPMGFYQPAQLIRDAIEHGVEVRPIDVNHSGYDCTLEPTRSPRPPQDNGSAATWGMSGPALRLGMRLVRGLSEEKVRPIADRRAAGPFRSIRDLARRTKMSRVVLTRLAAADAFRSLRLSRRDALWEVLAVDDADLPLFAHIEPEEGRPQLGAPPIERRVCQDYQTIGLSLEAHPMGLVRAALDVWKVTPAMDVRRMDNGRRVRVAGLCIIRQRPSTARGIVFATLEDETGVTNLVIRPHIFERFRQAAAGAAMLLADGRIERQGRVIHVQTTRLFDLGKALGPVPVRSRDFR